jgi:hypothetical protein
MDAKKPVAKKPPTPMMAMPEAKSTAPAPISTNLRSLVELGYRAPDENCGTCQNYNIGEGKCLIANDFVAHHGTCSEGYEQSDASTIDLVKSANDGRMPWDAVESEEMGEVGVDNEAEEGEE